MKAIIPVAGIGSRLQPYSNHIQKCLLPVAGKPILEHILEPLHEIGITEVTLITGHFSDQVEKFTKQYPHFNYNLIKQEKRLGLGHAIFMACRQIDEPLLVILGDSIFQLDYKSFISTDHSKIGVQEVNDPQRFGIVETQNDVIIKLVEKPDNPPTNLAIAGIYYFQSENNLYNNLEYLISNNIKTKGEYQLTDGMQKMLDNGEIFKTFKIDNWLDCGLKETLLTTNKYLLNNENYISSDAHVESSNLKSCTIGNGCSIENSNLDNVIMLDGSSAKDTSLKDEILDFNQII
ncbi:MAG: NTP transferase domain-containing protein [Candidatus Marinimicrobia bacterium]|jgi:glucose-1-phosphate thymidylyltransferase|nr:NTP transferase domain-containing protein [Candidatus Neomarinimicrobiota bacterium]MBT3633402.1 NTP transferase domain-containing protein [Candidatus Neomarinimicrobiota bacterium]MBT3681545.1 NTP transferase domain-containing protein [Candidatus Neomarinimicrobiota bacterium]MBT3758488.1 NTP transferase domain-containing protein [Candidatus Neomarinimicrobiota bacterium]MBT3894858.1 NTP transferase domain-containing protein [Candidatus Neomarinimicrobiota bacterium]